MKKMMERPSSSGDEDQLEGMLVRKHEWQSTTKKASNRSWNKVYTVLRGVNLMVYKDFKSSRATPEIYHHGEPPIEVTDGQSSTADDYTKKKNVFRLKLSNGADYLYQTKDEEEMSMWIGALNASASGEGLAGPSHSQNLPAGSEKKDEPKRRSFFTLKKK